MVFLRHEPACNNIPDVKGLSRSFKSDRSTGLWAAEGLKRAEENRVEKEKITTKHILYSYGYKTMIKNIALVCFFTIASASHIWAQEKNDITKWVEEAEEFLESVDNYTVVFYRQMQVEGELKEKETMFLKFKKPLNFYLKWIEQPHKGRELLYVEGENKNRVKVHGTGLLSPITINIDPRSSLIMKNSRHPVTEIGIDYITKIVGGEFRRGIERGEIEITYHGEEMVFSRKTMKIEGVFPRNVDKRYYCYRAVIYMDLETKILISIEVYDWENKLFEYYGFENLNVNTGLDKGDFDPKNTQYGF